MQRQWSTNMVFRGGFSTSFVYGIAHTWRSHGVVPINYFTLDPVHTRHVGFKPPLHVFSLA